MDLKTIYRKIRTRVCPNIKFLPQSKIRICGCCRKLTLFASFSDGDELKLCIRCLANRRYEMLAEYLRESIPDIGELVVVELDHRSPLRDFLSNAKKYVRTYYSNTDRLGSVRHDGAQCEDITRMTFADESVDVLISSDVLEHVPDVAAALRESYRVLRPGGVHLFTVPTVDKTVKRAEIVGGDIRLLVPPEYHSDPLNPQGIIAFWTFGMDLGSLFSTEDLSISLVTGPCGKDNRVVWKAEKVIEHSLGKTASLRHSN
jgi:SAM-dependent methyltransferase